MGGGIRNACVFALLVAVYDLIDRTATFPVNHGGVVVITGATSGLGQHAAYHIARDMGYIVLAGARTRGKADALQADAMTRGVPADRFEAIVLDVNDAEHFAAAEKSARAKMASAQVPFAGLINNAGVHNHQLGGDAVPTLELYRRLFHVNLYAPVALVEAFDALLRADKGRVINVGSVAGEVSLSATGAKTAYSASKHALRSVTDAMRRAYAGSGVSVSLVAPGYVASQMCDPKRVSACAAYGPGETTTPAYADALTSPRPRSKYLVAHIGNGLSAAVWIPILRALPNRMVDAIMEIRARVLG